MTASTGGRWRALTAIAIPATAVMLVVSSSSASGYGAYNSLGQNAEHERITRTLSSVFQPGSMNLLAGTTGQLGGVGAPDNLTDSGLINGLGPAYKHCDDGDFLPTAGYPNTLAAAHAALRACIQHFEGNMNAAVGAAGRLLNADGNVALSQAAASFKVCNWPYAWSQDASDTAKCAVLNRLGRALHVAEDFWAHTNWADSADPTKPLSPTNPAGLGRTDIPAVMRYPGASIAPIPDGLISGCDDSVPFSGCRGRVGHGDLAKDNGTIAINQCQNAVPTPKYSRGLIVGPTGINNFALGVCGAKAQAEQVWADFSAVVLARYGSVRGHRMLTVITHDTVPPAIAARHAEPTGHTCPNDLVYVGADETLGGEDLAEGVYTVYAEGLSCRAAVTRAEEWTSTGNVPAAWVVDHETPTTSVYPADGSEDLVFVNDHGSGVRDDDVIVLTRIG